MHQTQELDTLRTQKGSNSIDHAEIEAQSAWDKDQVELARTGKKQILKVRTGPMKSARSICSMLIEIKRNFGFMSTLGFSCTLMATWEGVLVCV